MDSKIGPHIVREEGDVVSIRVIGDLEAVHMQRLLEMIEGIIQRYGRYGTLIDTRQMTRLSPETRKLVTEFKGASSCFGNAVFGGLIRPVSLFSMAPGVLFLAGCLSALVKRMTRGGGGTGQSIGSRSPSRRAVAKVGVTGRRGSRSICATW